MARRSILDEGEQKQNDSTEPTKSDKESENESEDSSETNENNQNEEKKSERIQTTLRLPSELADDLDDWADLRGMSRNAAVTYFIAEGLSE